jgi:hypothetical protein
MTHAVAVIYLKGYRYKRGYTVNHPDYELYGRQSPAWSVKVNTDSNNQIILPTGPVRRYGDRNEHHEVADGWSVRVYVPRVSEREREGATCFFWKNLTPRTRDRRLSLDYSDADLDPTQTPEQFISRFQREVSAYDQAQKQDEDERRRKRYSPNGDGPCFIATAACGDPFAPEVVALSAFRDDVLLRNRIGKAFVRLYYVVSPPIAAVIAQSGVLRSASMALVVRPACYFVSSWRG